MSTTMNPSAMGLRFERAFSSEGIGPFDQVRWERRTAEILGKGGEPVFRQEDVEVPDFWSQRATAIVFDKYAYGRLGTPERETSVRQIVGRVVDTIVGFGADHGYFAGWDDQSAFSDDLTWLLLNQYASFNSPVWFNVGCRPATGWSWDLDANDGSVIRNGAEPRYQVSACFILGMEDTIESIAATGTAEMRIFKDGSGAGGDRSVLRSSREPITGGGKASGPVSFISVYDAIGAVTKSGGRTRRAARMDTLKCWHPDIREFIECKRLEEMKARALIDAGYDGDFNGEAYQSVKFQNCNMSVRATDAFLQAVEDDRDWQTLSVVTGRAMAADGTPMPRYKARLLMDLIAEGTWTCGDPGIQYEDTIQAWHTTPNAGPINSSNPCSEYMHVDNSACNLASINLMKFRCDDGKFDVRRFRAACRILAVAMDILVDLGSYPTPEIARNAHRFRQLGLGYTNLGSLIMASGLPYDSEEGRSLAGAITAIMTGQVYLTSAELAEKISPFDGFRMDREFMLSVIRMHRDAASVSFRSAHDVSEDYPSDLWCDAVTIWNEVGLDGQAHGYRNAQATVLAPAGTISFMMDADTTGVEPAIALVSYKNLWGRGQLKLINQTIPMALKALGYGDFDRTGIETFILDHDTIEGAPFLNPDHLPVFDCAFPPACGSLKRSISWRGHLRMVAAVQPFLSGAVSKTINMPNDSTIAEIRDAYMEGWKLGLKAVAIYRDGSKGSQPVSTSPGGSNGESGNSSLVGDRDPRNSGLDSGGLGVTSHRSGVENLLSIAPRRERLPDTRRSVTHKLTVGSVEAYLTVGHYPDGRPGEIFVEVAKQGSTVGGLMDAWATMVSIALQYGVPAEVIAEKFSGGRFEPSGITRNPDIPFASSLIDYVARWIGMTYVPNYRETHAPRRSDVPSSPPGPVSSGLIVVAHAPICLVCGGLCQPAGACWFCMICGTSQGGCG